MMMPGPFVPFGDAEGGKENAAGNQGRAQFTGCLLSCWPLGAVEAESIVRLRVKLSANGRRARVWVRFW